MRFKRAVTAILCLAMVLCVGTYTKKITSAAAPAAVVGRGRPVLIIDAGHGGFDGGAIAEDGTVEKDLNLQIALQVEGLAKAFGLQTVMVRTTDTSTDAGTAVQTASRKVADMKNRLQLMSKYENCIFVSIHQNKYSTAQPTGAQVFYAPRVAGSEVLAEQIQNVISAALQSGNHRVIKSGTKDTYLLYYATAPAVIVECGFMSNPVELANLKDTAYQQKMALSIVTGIIYYYSTEV